MTGLSFSSDHIDAPPLHFSKVMENTSTGVNFLQMKILWTPCKNSDRRDLPNTQKSGSSLIDNCRCALWSRGGQTTTVKPVQIESNIGGIPRWDNVPPVRAAAPAPAPAPPPPQAIFSGPQPTAAAQPSDAGVKYLLYYVNGLPVLLAVKPMP
jgi:hypothetical protein